MTKPRNNRRKKGLGGNHIAALVLFVLVIIMVISAYLITKPKIQTKSVQIQTPFTTAVRPETQIPIQTIISSSHQKKYESANKEQIPTFASPVPHTYTARNGKLSIIIDDMGNSMREARLLAAIGVPLTFSVIPGLPQFREVAAFAVSQDIEVMIHMPMQSKGWPQRRLEPNGLLVSMDDTAISSQINEFITLLPGASGANNHMGSEFTEHKEKMRPVLALLKEKDLFFIDSVTTPNSVGYSMARNMKIKTARRNVFLDNEQSPDYILGQLRHAVALAGKNGSAIAICHPHPATISTLAAFLPTLKQQGITLTPASQIVRE